jgi:hypothetical protein
VFVGIFLVIVKDVELVGELRDGEEVFRIRRVAFLPFHQVKTEEDIEKTNNGTIC